MPQGNPGEGREDGKEKKKNKLKQNRTMTVEELQFATWCIGNVARELNIDDKSAYRRLKDTDVLDGYIIASYDVLHTFGKRYLMDDIITLMTKREAVC